MFLKRPRKRLRRENIKAKWTGDTSIFGEFTGRRDKFKSFRKKRFGAIARRNFAEKKAGRNCGKAGVNLVGVYDHRRAGLSQEGEFECSECGYTAQFRKDLPFYLEGTNKHKVDHQGNRTWGKDNQKWKRSEKDGKNQGKGKNRA